MFYNEFWLQKMAFLTSLGFFILLSILLILGIDPLTSLQTSTIFYLGIIVLLFRKDSHNLRKDYTQAIRNLKKSKRKKMIYVHLFPQKLKITRGTGKLFKTLEEERQAVIGKHVEGGK